MAHAIIVKILGPANAVIEATAYFGSITVPYDRTLDPHDQAPLVAMALLEKYQRPVSLHVGGYLPGRTDKLVFVPAVTGESGISFGR